MIYLTEKTDIKYSCSLLKYYIGGDVNDKEKSGWTVLMNAVQGGYTDMVQLLINAGVNVNARKDEKYNWTALSIAKDNGHQDLVFILERAGGVG